MTSATLSGYMQDVFHLLLQTQATNQYGREISLDSGARSAVDLVLEAKTYDQKIMAVGTGGGCALATQLQNDLARSLEMKAIVFDHAALLTGMIDDYGHECMYEHPIARWAENGDVLFAISSSGVSASIVRGVQAAVRNGCRIITLSGGAETNPLRCLGDLNFHVPSEGSGLVEMVHAGFLHYLTDCAVAVATGATARRSVQLRLLKNQAFSFV